MITFSCSGITWGQGNRSQAAEFGQRRLHLQLARLQGTLERVPDERLAKHLFRFQDQEAAVGPVQRPGRNCR